MIKETEVQSRLIDAARDEGGYGLKLSNRFVTGIPDLLIQIPGMCSRVIEVKKLLLPSRLDTPIKLELTPIQRRTLRDMRAAGAFAGWCLVMTDTEARNPAQYWVLVGTDPAVEKVSRQDVNAFAFIRKRGEPWPIRRICSTITMG